VRTLLGGVSDRTGGTSGHRQPPTAPRVCDSAADRGGSRRARGLCRPQGRRPPGRPVPRLPLPPARAHALGQPVVRRPLDPRLQRDLPADRGDPRHPSHRDRLRHRRGARIRPPRGRSARPQRARRVGRLRARDPRPGRHRPTAVPARRSARPGRAVGDEPGQVAPRRAARDGDGPRHPARRRVPRHRRHRLAPGRMAATPRRARGRARRRGHPGGRDVGVVPRTGGDALPVQGVVLQPDRVRRGRCVHPAEVEGAEDRRLDLPVRHGRLLLHPHSDRWQRRTPRPCCSCGRPGPR
jgi:hypothetical protein